MVMTSQLSPALGCTFGQLEHHDQTGFGTAVAFRFSVPEADRDERAFDRICCANVAPVVRRKVVER